MNKTAIVTGAGRGLGKGFVDYLVGEGYFVFAGVRDTSKYENRENVQYIELDISKDESIKNAYEIISEKASSLDLLINNAALNKDSATNGNKELVCNLDSLSRDHLNKMFDVNTVSPMIVTKAFYKLMLNDPSFIVNISSCRASHQDEMENSTANYGYRASKAGLNMMVFNLVRDLPENIKTFTVHPGSVLTDMNPNGISSPFESAKSIIEITKNWKEQFNGQFMRYSGELYPL